MFCRLLPSSPRWRSRITIFPMASSHSIWRPIFRRVTSLLPSSLPSVFSTRPPSIPHSSPLLMLLTPPTTFAPRRRSTGTILSSSPSCCSVFDKIGRSKEGRVGVPSYIFLSEIRPRSHLCRCWPSLIIKWQRFECMLCIAHSGLQSDASRLPHPHILDRADLQ